MGTTKNYIFLQLVNVAGSCLLAIALFFGGLSTDSQVAGFIIFLVIGISFILSKSLKSYLYFFRGVYWIAMNILKPKTKYNHIIWGIFSLFLSSFFVFFDETIDSDTEKFLQKIIYEKEFWVGVLGAVFFNIAVGVYTAANRKKNQ